MNATVTAVREVPALDHEEAMELARVEYERLLDIVATLAPGDWSRPTDCTEWDVRALLGHLLGMLEMHADHAEAGRQLAAAAAIAREQGRIGIDALTGLQVQEHAHLTTVELVRELRDAGPRALAGRRSRTGEQRAQTFTSLLPGERQWTVGYLVDVIQTRDPWIHRVDIARATDREMVLTPEHDGRIVADVVREWAERHGEPFTLVLHGPAGGSFAAGEGEPRLHHDAIEFCRMLSGRAPASGLVATHVPF